MLSPSSPGRVKERQAFAHGTKSGLKPRLVPSTSRGAAQTTARPRPTAPLTSMAPPAESVSHTDAPERGSRRKRRLKATRESENSSQPAVSGPARRTRSPAPSETSEAP